MDLLVTLLGGRVRVPRQVFDPEGDPDGPEDLGSEIAVATRRFLRRARDADAITHYSRLRALWQRKDIEAIDLDEDELSSYAEIKGLVFTKRLGLAVPLGDGEAAVIAIAEAREWSVIMDDAKGREALDLRAPGTQVWTTRDLLVIAERQKLITRKEADSIYVDMQERSYKGPDLWD